MKKSFLTNSDEIDFVKNCSFCSKDLLFSSKDELEEVYRCNDCDLEIQCYDGNILSITFIIKNRLYNVGVYGQNMYSIYKYKYSEIPWFDFNLKYFKNVSKEIVKRFSLNIFS